jgi:hypothetical protein
VYIGDVIEFETAKRLEPRSRGTEAIGADLGFRSLIVASSGSLEHAESSAPIP